MINFYPMIRKIKIDVFLDRSASTLFNTQYLKPYKSKIPFLSIKARSIKMNHLILSTLMAHKSNFDDMESLSFYDQSTIKKLIDLQQPFVIKFN